MLQRLAEAAPPPPGTELMVAETSAVRAFPLVKKSEAARWSCASY